MFQIEHHLLLNNKINNIFYIFTLEESPALTQEKNVNKFTKLQFSKKTKVIFVTCTVPKCPNENFTPLQELGL